MEDKKIKGRKLKGNLSIFHQKNLVVYYQGEILEIPYDEIKKDDKTPEEFVERQIDRLISIVYPDKNVLEICKEIPEGEENIWYNGQGYYKLFDIDDIKTFIEVVRNIKK